MIDIYLTPCIRRCDAPGSALAGGQEMYHTGREYPDTPRHEFGHIAGFLFNRANGTNSIMSGDRPRAVNESDIKILFDGYNKLERQ